MGKKAWKSRTVLLNILSVIALLIQTQTGFIISPAEQLTIVNVANLALRAVTGEPLEK